VNPKQAEVLCVRNMYLVWYWGIDAVREMMTARLARKGFEVVAASANENAEIYNHGNTRRAHHRFAHAECRRWFQRDAPLPTQSAVIPHVQSAMAAIALEADEIIKKPFEVERSLT
jgi:hypothetical protein